MLQLLATNLHITMICKRSCNTEQYSNSSIHSEIVHFNSIFILLLYLVLIKGDFKTLFQVLEGLVCQSNGSLKIVRCDGGAIIHYLCSVDLQKIFFIYCHITTEIIQGSFL